MFQDYSKSLQAITLFIHLPHRRLINFIQIQAEFN